MSFKFKVVSLDDACPSCPFYLPGTDGKHHCFVKRTVPLTIAIALTDRKDTSELPEDWDRADCGGDWDTCSVLPILYNPPAPQLAADHELPAREEFEIDDFNPYEETDEPDPQAYSEDQELDEEEPEEIEPIVSKPSTKAAEPVKKAPVKEVRAETNRKNISRATAIPDEEEAEEAETEVSVSIHHQANPYLVTADVLVYPNNANLIVDDETFIDMTKDHIQDACDQVKRPIRMGHVYCTNNGSTQKYRSRVAAKLVYHAVVAGESRLVNTNDIKSAVFRSLATAESHHARTLVMLPMDCGMLDTQQVALTQLGAIQHFLSTTETKTLQHIYIVIQDEDTVKVFEEFFDRIFGRAK